MTLKERQVLGAIAGALAGWLVARNPRLLVALVKADRRESGEGFPASASAGPNSGAAGTKLAKDTGSMSERSSPAAAKWSAFVFLVALVLFAVHGLFHLWEWIAWPPPDALQALYGASEAGRYVHAVTEAIIALALFLGLWEALK